MNTARDRDDAKTMDGLPRFGIFAAPVPESPWWTFGCRWLGRDPITDKLLAPEALGGLSIESWNAVTMAPRHYGFHGTLVPPFALAEGHTLTQLRQAVASTVLGRSEIVVPRLQLTSLGRFLALRPDPDEPRIAALAADCLLTLDRFRAAESPEQRARRERPSLSALERRMLREWGYPYVLDAYRFHLTLTASLADADREQVAAALRPLLEPLESVPLRLDALWLVGQPNRATPFRFLDRFCFDGTARHLGDLP